MKYGFEKEVDYSVEEAVARVIEELGKDGFGMMTRIDVDEKLKEKIGVDFKRYVILGMCNPNYAYEALEIEENIGLYLPCNVIVYEKQGKSLVAMLKPKVAMGPIENRELDGLLEKVEGIFECAIRRV